MVSSTKVQNRTIWNLVTICKIKLFSKSLKMTRFDLQSFLRQISLQQDCPFISRPSFPLPGLHQKKAKPILSFFIMWIEKVFFVLLIYSHTYIYCTLFFGSPQSEIQEVTVCCGSSTYWGEEILSILVYINLNLTDLGLLGI